MYVINSHRKKEESINDEPFNELTINTALDGSVANGFVLSFYHIDHVTVDWGDGAVENFSVGGNRTHYYNAPGIYTIKMYGTGSQMFRLVDSVDKKKVIGGVIGNTGWITCNSIFSSCSSLAVLDVSTLDMSDVTNFSFALYGCSSLAALDASAWVMSANLQANSYSGTFRNCGTLDLKIGAGWNFSALTEGYDASTFLQGTDIGSTNYDNMLSIIASQTLNNNVTFGGGNSKYTAAGKVYRDAIIANHGWTFIDGGACSLT